MLSIEMIRQHLDQKSVEMCLFDVIDSTNTYLKSFKHHPVTRICLAEQQTQGRGRFDRHWYAPHGQNIYLSCLYTFKKPIHELSGLGLVVGLALLSVLNRYATFAVKWPNDIVFEKKKIAGILIEGISQRTEANQVVVGVGVNVNMVSDAEGLTSPWTSLKAILGQAVDRNELAAQIINALLQYFALLEQDGFTQFIDQWNRADILMGNVVTLLQAHQSLSGTVLGVDNQGCLLLALPGGEVRAFASGEVSVQKA